MQDSLAVLRVLRESKNSQLVGCHFDFWLVRMAGRSFFLVVMNFLKPLILFSFCFLITLWQPWLTVSQMVNNSMDNVNFSQNILTNSANFKPSPRSSAAKLRIARK